MLQYLVFLAAGVSLVSTYSYIRSMLDGHAKPNRITWLMWTVAPIIAFAAAVSTGARLAAVPVLMAGFSPFLIFVASFAVKEAYWRLSKLDYACGILSAMAMFFWVATGNPDIAIVFAILSDTLASVPTIMKAWQYPETESPWVYSTGVCNGLTGLLAITAWAFSQYAFPGYLVVIDGLLVLSICRKRVLLILEKVSHRWELRLRLLILNVEHLESFVRFVESVNTESITSSQTHRSRRLLPAADQFSHNSIWPILIDFKLSRP